MIALARTPAIPPLARHAASLAPVLRAVAAAAGPEGRSCLIETGGAVERAATALAIVRAMADDHGPGRLLTRVLREMLFEAERDLGDGTARLALLWGGMMMQGAQALASGIAADRLVAALDRLGTRLSAALASAGTAGDRRMLALVAESAGATPDISQALAGMVEQVGPDGAADIVESRTPELRFERHEGFLFDAAPASELFAKIDLDPAFILVVDDRIEDLGPLVPLLEGFATRGKALVVVAREIAGPALQALVRSHRENGLRAVALRPSAVGPAAADILEDLAVATGATLVADRFGTQIASLRPRMLGRCARFTLTGGLATFLEPAGDIEAIADRRRLLIAEAERHKFLALDRERLQLRAARLRGLSVRLHIGTVTERATATQVATARRALATARAAARSGTVLGGGLALVRAFDNLPLNQAGDTLLVEAAARQVMAAGVSTLVRGLSGALHDGSGPVSTRIGGLARALDLGDEAGRGVFDPTSLTRAILDRAVSGAIPLLRSGGIIHG